MKRQDFDPAKFIGREYELGVFQELLTFEGDIRILAIQDTGGMGKSVLLKQFQHICHTHPVPVAASIIALDQLPDAHPSQLAHSLVLDLKSSGVAFPRFDQQRRSRGQSDVVATGSASSLQGTSQSGASNKAGDEPGAEIRTDVVALTSEQEIAAQEAGIKAFLNDLTVTDSTCVVMFDAYERGHPLLRTFIETVFIQTTQLTSRLLVVLAGREIPDLDVPHQFMNELTRWEQAHVEQFLQINNYTYTATHLTLFKQMAERGMPPSLIIQGIDAVLRRQ